MLHDWASFFTLSGTAGAQLIGLLFVIVTLGTGLSMSHSVDGMRAFLTPTLLSFSGVLFQAVAALVPWPSDWQPGVIFILVGLAGITYRIGSIRFKRQLDFVTLRRVDWVAYDGVPVIGNVSVIAGGAGLIAEQAFAPYAIATSTGLLLAAGIYSAWDLTMWMMKNRDKS